MNSANARTCYVCVSPLASAQADPAPASGRRYASFPDEVAAASSETDMDTGAAIARDLLKSLQKKSAAKRPRMPKAVETPVATLQEEVSAESAAVIEPEPPAMEAAAAAPAQVEPASRPQEAQSRSSAAGFAEAKRASETIYGGAKAPVLTTKAVPAAKTEEPPAQQARTLNQTIYGGPKAPPLAPLKSPVAAAPDEAPLVSARLASETIYGAVKAPLVEPPIKWEARIDWSAEQEVMPPNTHEPVFAAETELPGPAVKVQGNVDSVAATSEQAAVAEVPPIAEEAVQASASKAPEDFEAEIESAMDKVRSAAAEMLEKVQTETRPEETELVAVGAPATDVAALNATTIGARAGEKATSAFASVTDRVAEPPAPPRATSSTTWGSVQPSVAASEDWRRELSNRVEAYRSRTGTTEDEPALPFAAEPIETDHAAQIEADLAAAEATSAEAPAEPPSPRASLRTAARRRTETVEILALQPEFDFAGAETDEHPHSPLVPVADLSERRAAGLLDSAFLAASFLAFLVCFTSLGTGKITFGKMELVILGVVFFLFYVQYFGLFTIFGGITPGMMIRGLRPVSFDGSTPSAQQLLQRSFGYIVSAGSLLLGFLWSLWDEDHLTWHDRMSHTYLTQTVPQTASEDR